MTSVGLQTQYEAVCENLGLIAYLVQVVVIIIIHITVIIIITRPNAALRVAGLDWIVKPGYSFDGYLRHGAAPENGPHQSPLIELAQSEGF